MDHFEFASIDESTWAALQRAAAEPREPLRYLGLCSVGVDNTPKARTLVLRAARQGTRELEFHTDVRSPKWQELEANPATTILGYDPIERLQLRFEGEVRLHAPGEPRNVNAWSKLSQWTKTTYQGGPPGDAVSPSPDGPEPSAPREAELNEGGRERFGVLMFRAASLDWFRLERGNNRRLLFRFAASGAAFSAQWINP